MKDFKLWFFLENYKDLIKVYRDRMKDTPENKHHHPEGNSWEHVKLVYRAILSKAKQELNNLKNNHPIVSNILSDIDFSITTEELFCTTSKNQTQLVQMDKDFYFLRARFRERSKQ